jgi:hypothetical protein
MLKSPVETRTPKKLKAKPSVPREGAADLADMICKNENGDVRVKPPQIPVSPLPDRYKALQVTTEPMSMEIEFYAIGFK